MIAIVCALLAFQAPNDEEPPKKVIDWADRLIDARAVRMKRVAEQIGSMQSSRTVDSAGNVISMADKIKEFQKYLADLKSGSLPVDLYSMPFQPVQYDIGYISNTRVIKIIDPKTFLAEFTAYEAHYGPYLGGVRRTGETKHTSRVLIRGFETIALVDDRDTRLNAVMEATGVDMYRGKRLMVLEKFDDDKWKSYLESRSKKKTNPKKTAPKSQESSPESLAASKLKLTKAVKNSNPEAYKQRLKELIEMYPTTDAAKEAAELLGK